MKKNKKKSESQKQQDKKGKDRMSYYLRKKAEKLANKVQAMSEKQFTYWEKIVPQDDEWEERIYER